MSCMTLSIVATKTPHRPFIGQDRPQVGDTDPEGSVRDLFTRLDSADAATRKAATHEAGRMIYRLATALSARLGDESGPVRQAAARAAREFGPAMKQVLPGLAGAMGDEDWLTRLWAAHALSAIGPSSREAAPVVRKALQDPSRYVRNAAFVTLTQIERG